jgi:hypothetical protein
MNVVFPCSANNLAAIAEVNEESNPPDSNTPMGTSLIKRLRVASIRVLQLTLNLNFDQPFHNLHRQACNT